MRVLINLNLKVLTDNLLNASMPLHLHFLPWERVTVFWYFLIMEDRSFTETSLFLHHRIVGATPSQRLALTTLDQKAEMTLMNSRLRHGPERLFWMDCIILQQHSNQLSLTLII